jgi:hypothetical protein
MAHAKKAMAAIGEYIAFAVKRWRTLWTGNHNAGRDKSQNRKKLTKPLVSTPALAEMLLCKFL